MNIDKDSIMNNTSITEAAYKEYCMTVFIGINFNQWLESMKEKGLYWGA